MPIIAGLIIGGTTLASGAIGAQASQQAAAQQEEAAQQALEEQRRQFDLQWEAAAPSRNALAQLNAILSGEQQLDVTTLPGYQEQLQEGLRATQIAQAGGPGGRFGGRALRELMRYGSTLASNERTNYLNRLSNLAGLAPNPASPNTAGTIMAGGAAQAAGTLGSASAINNALQGGASNWLSFMNQQNLTNLLNPPAPAWGGAQGAGAGLSVGGM